jgi:hypothetical protein
MRSRVLLCAFAVAIAVPTLAVPQASHAGSYPGTKCVATKLKAASGNCKSALGAWSKFVGGGGTDTAKRDAALTKATTKMSDTWTKSEEKSLAQGSDCADTTLSSGDMQTLIDGAITTIVTDATGGLTLSNKDDAKCGAALLKAAASRCASLLKNEASYVGKQSGGKGKRDAGNDKADDKFDASVTATLASCPNATATLSSLDEGVDELTEDVTTNSIISPNLDDTQFTTISPTGTIPYQGDDLKPKCSFNTPYHYFVKRGSVNKLVMYYQGGGACWDPNTCVTLGTFDKDVNPAGSDNPNNTTTGFGDLTNPSNPFKDWNIVFVSYCTGDIHFGDFNPSYAGTPTYHHGWHNARVAEKFAREHFVAPDEVFVTGSSAGAYGAFFNAPLHREVWPASQMSVLADAGNGIITFNFLKFKFPIWNFEAHLPTNIPGVVESITDFTGIPAFTKAVADYFPDVLWAHYTSSYDGGTGGQTGFYNVMLEASPINWVSWWTKSCAWNSVMVQQAHDTAAEVPSNYRYYIGTGSRHTMYGSNKVYTDTTGGVPTIVDWVNQMLNRDPLWDNEECSPASACGTTLPGDPLPTTRMCEGGSNDGATCSNDSACPGGVCGYAAPFDVVGPDVVITCP